LAEVVAHFVKVITGRECSIMDGRKGLRIIELREYYHISTQYTIQ